MYRFIFFLLVLISSFQVQAQRLMRKDIGSGWQFSQAGLNEWMRATVPGTVQTDLLANEKIHDPYFGIEERSVQWIDKVGWSYKTSFDADPAWMKSDHAELVFEGLDTYATVWLNRKKILEADNMFLAWRADIKSILQLKNNELLVAFRSPIFEGLKKQSEYGLRLPASNDQSETGQIGSNQVSIFTRKAGYHYGWDWGPRLVPSGIWRPVYIEAWNDIRISDVFISTLTLSGKTARLRADITVLAGKPSRCNLVLQSGNQIWLSVPVELIKGNNRINREFEVKKPSPWWPRGYGEQYLYPVTCTISNESGSISDYSLKTGIHTVRLVQDPDPDGNGRSFYFEVNGLPVFAKGANYIPSDVFLPRVTPDEYRKVVSSAAFANMNMLRVWGGGIYENDLFYDLCDEAGILIWQDFMFACSMYPGNDEFLASVTEEARQNIIRLRNHPSIALWCGNN
ncbi:MAG: glycoside hydrolase family 2 protein, partial [Bacteroidota bacterium]